MIPYNSIKASPPNEAINFVDKMEIKANFARNLKIFNVHICRCLKYFIREAEQKLHSSHESRSQLI